MLFILYVTNYVISIVIKRKLLVGSLADKNASNIICKYY